MKHFSDELEGHDVYYRDRWQFELKSDFLPDPEKKKNTFTQEFYFFIPDSLRINKYNFPLKQFYRDQTNLIRLKTPVFTLKELNNLTLPSSPLTQIASYTNKAINPQNQHQVEKELKLLGNVFRSTLRTRAQLFFSFVDNNETKTVQEDVEQFCIEIQTFFDIFYKIQQDLLKKWDLDELKLHFHHIDNFMKLNLDQYVVKMLSIFRESKACFDKKTDKMLCDLLLANKTDLSLSGEDELDNETFIYRKTLLNKYVLDALLLDINRFSPQKKYQNIIGSVAAGIAMLIFFTLFVWQGNIFVINSIPFILITVILYILKDRIKEWLKLSAHHQKLGWMSDFTTKIKSPDSKEVLGDLKETFSFIGQDEIPDEIHHIRNKQFHEVLETYERPETCIYYKKTMNIYEKPKELAERYFMLNVIFRFNIRHFMDKASNPYHPHLWLEEEKKEILYKRLPKVYHLNIIMKSSSENEGKRNLTEIKKFRIVADKNGIKRVEYL